MSYYIPNSKNKDEVLAKIEFFKKTDLSSLFIITDFNKTLTKDQGNTSWSIFPKSGILGEDYVKDRNALFAQYNTLEIDETTTREQKAQIMNEWYIKHFELFLKYKLTKSQFNDIVGNRELIKFRDGVAKFIGLTIIDDIPLVIVSGGIGNVIESMIKQCELLAENVFIEGNFFGFDANGLASSISTEKIINAFNKDNFKPDELTLDAINGKENCILIGDSIDDCDVAKVFPAKNILKIAYTTKDRQKEYFDDKDFDIVVLDEDFGFVNEILER
ncbi:MAG: hypothetical protein PHF26_00070 [Candidatus Gracilibacteria bacterium]|nr:hypothetical protein [Candidatus Gracilibacteria bacterium]